MTHLPLGRIRLAAGSHKSALLWIFLLYKNPDCVRVEAIKLPRGRGSLISMRLFLHIFPYIALLNIFLRSILTFRIIIHEPQLLSIRLWIESLSLMGLQLIGVFTCATLVIILGSYTSNLVNGVALGLALSLATTVAVFIGSLIDKESLPIFRISFGFFIGIVLSISGWNSSGVPTLSRFTALLIKLLRLPLRPPLTCCLGLFSTSCLSSAIFLILLLFIFYYGFIVIIFILPISLSAILGYTRAFYLPIHFLWLALNFPGSFYRFHPMAWDNLCRYPFPGMSHILVACAENDYTAGEHEIDRLIAAYPSRRQGALRARAILVARRAASTGNLSRLDEILVDLPEGNKGFLLGTPELRRRVHEICALQTRLDTLDRPFLREPFAALLVKEIETFEQQVAGFRPPLVIEFRKAARQWLMIANRQVDAARKAVVRETTRQVFRAGDPVDREREAFVLRGVIVGEIERQVMLANGCPGLLIYGRRRMGKSTLLRNLDGLLPPRVHVVSLSMQEARAFTSLPELVRLIALRVEAALPGDIELTADLPGLQSLLDSTQQRLEADDLRLLLSVDEYENLDSKIGEGVFPEDLLAVLRESIQTHRRIIWTFAGSHSIDELVHAPWASYLVSARTIEVTPFEPAETRLLLTEPLKNSSLWRAAETDRPRFEPGFWGNGGIERVHAEAGGWPHLVQLVAETVVDLVNDSGGASVDVALLERALDRAVIRGNNVLLELMERESRLPGEWDYLRAFRQLEEQPVPADESLDRSLRRRRLVVEEGGHYRLRVPLMARWLRQRI